jgi:nucleoside 2-deoxyribosyltransferase
VKVYLAGAITGLTYGDGQGWRTYAKSELAKAGIWGYSPLRAKEYLEEHGILEGSYEDFPLSSAKGIMTRDHWDVSTSDLILMNLLETTKVSIGSVIEMGMAYAYRKPVVLVMEKGNIHTHPMMEQAAFVVDDLDVGLKLVKSILLPDLDFEKQTFNPRRPIALNERTRPLLTTT